MADTVLAAQLYTLRDYLKTPQDIAASFKKVREIGYKAVQLSGLGPIDPAELKRIADGEGLTICATHVGFERVRDETEKVIEEHKLWECEVVAIPVAPTEYRSGEGYKRFAEEATALGQKFAEAGIRLAYHNHAFEFERYGDRTGLQILYEESDPKYLEAELDTYWVQAGGADPAWLIRMLKDRQTVIHLKDMAVVDNKQVFAEVGEGNLNWPAILEACKEANIRWYIVEQDVCPGDPFESLAVSLRNLQAMGLK